MRRRRALQVLCASAAGGLTAAASAGGGGASQPPPANLTPEEVEVLSRGLGRSFSEAERRQVAQRLSGYRTRLAALREDPLLDGSEPAVTFHPLPPARLPAVPRESRPSAVRTPRYDGNPESVAFLSVLELGRLLRSGKLTSAELTRMYLDRLRRYGARLECLVTLTEERALEQAARADREFASGKDRGPLHGIPWGAKDLFATRGIRTTWGAAPYEHQVFDYDATVVQRLEAAGAVLVAKLTSGELALGDQWFGGMTRNPWRPSLGSSGSSAGPGSATAAGLVGFSLGTETLGSIVSPCVVNGVTGLRPTYGRVPRTGCMALSWTMDKIGPMCRAVEDCAVVLAAIAGPDGRDRSAWPEGFGWRAPRGLSGLRVGLDEASFQGAGRNPEDRAIYDEALAVLRRLGAELKPVQLPRGRAGFNALAGTIIDVESAAAFQKLVASGKAGLLKGQGVGSWPNTFRTGSLVPAVDYLNAQRLRTRLQEAMADVFRDIDIYISIPRSGPSLVYTNLTGHPCVVTRCGMREGLPRMIEFTAQPYREDQALQAALAFERATSWNRQWPDVEAGLRTAGR